MNTDLSIVEDCAEAIGSRFGDRHVGTFGDVATWSFFGNKTITTGEGGMVTTSRAELDAGIRKLKGQGLAGHREYWHDVIGYNYRMTNICAAIGVAQLPHAGEFLQRKRVIATAYRDGLAGLTGRCFVASARDDQLLLDELPLPSVIAAQRDPLRKHLASEGIETRPTFYPAHSMPMYERYGTGNYPVAEALATRGMNLPSSPALTDQDVTRIVESIRRYFV